MLDIYLQELVNTSKTFVNTSKTFVNTSKTFVNTSKTKVMIFNKKVGVIHHKPSLTYDGVELEVVNDFKYLGDLFSVHNTRGNNRYLASIDNRLRQAKRLVAAWMRRCEILLFKPDVIINQFNTCVMPALEYGVPGVGLWGVGMYKSDSWKKVEVFWRYIARCILGVSQRAPNGGVYGDLGWYSFEVRAA